MLGQSPEGPSLGWVCKKVLQFPLRLLWDPFWMASASVVLADPASGRPAEHLLGVLMCSLGPNTRLVSQERQTPAHFLSFVILSASIWIWVLLVGLDPNLRVSVGILRVVQKNVRLGICWDNEFLTPSSPHSQLRMTPVKHVSFLPSWYSFSSRPLVYIFILKV